MPEIEIEWNYNKICRETIKAFKSGIEVIIHKGGTGSGKTYEIMIFLIFFYCLEYPGKIVTIVSESKPHLDIGTIRIMKSLLMQFGIYSDDSFNSSKGYYTFSNGTILEFFSADRIEKALGARRDVLYGNEINSLKFEIWDELARRSSLVIADFNPTSQFWLEKFLEYYGNYIVIKSNYKNNSFISERELNRIERRAMLDENFKRVHIDCEYGIYEGLIFKDWHQVDEFPQNAKVNYGLDFGYTNDPSVLVKAGVIDDKLYVDELFYEYSLTNFDIRKKLNSLNVGTSEIIADSSEPKSIDEIYRSPNDSFGRFNIKPAVKGPDSVNFGINRMKEYQMFVTKRSTNIIRELRNYSWMKDKNSETINKPIDAFNHGIDAIRYAISNKPKQTFKYRMA